ncbi:MAG: hypothetical protein LZ166_01135 [Thaumarchaeota archaeon]|jgi:hypothetical protein|nr:hypothetical protein [Candidatus Wolframiiraptor allenii]
MEITKIVAVILALLLAAALLACSPRIIEGIRAPSLEPTRIEDNPQFLWANRWLDLLIQAFILFAVIIAVSSQLGRGSRLRW